MEYKRYLVELDEEISRIIREISRYKSADPEGVSKLTKRLKEASISLRDYCINLLYDPAYEEMLKNPDFLRYIFCQGIDTVSYDIKICIRNLNEAVKKDVLPKEVKEIIKRLESVDRGLKVVERRMTGLSQRLVKTKK